MKSSQVRDLARRYATGKLSQENYRNQRRSLIDSITGGGVQLAYREDERAVVRPRFNSKLLGIVVVSLIAAGIATVLVLKLSTAGHPTGAQAATTTEAPAAAPPAPGPELVHTFVETNDWSDVSLQGFERRWDALGADGQSAARDSLMYPRLASGIRQQIESEKAVAGGGAADAHLVELQKLAKTLGIPPS